MDLTTRGVTHAPVGDERPGRGEYPERDFDLLDHGPVILVRPTNEEARAWLKEVTPEDATWWVGAIAVEPRYLPALIEGIIEEGFLL